ncbi:MAG: transposase [bacterium]|nr:transposase [bacterium]
MDTATGNVITSVTPRNRAEEFRRFLNLINREVPPELQVHVVLDNASTHKTPAIERWLQRHPRFTFHFTPTYASWMNLVERWFFRTHYQTHTPRHPPISTRTHRLHPPMDRTLEPRPQTLYLAQDRRRNLRQPHPLSTVYSQHRTLGGWCLLQFRRGVHEASLKPPSETPPALPVSPDGQQCPRGPKEGSVLTATGAVLARTPRRTVPYHRSVGACP